MGVVVTRFAPPKINVRTYQRYSSDCPSTLPVAGLTKKFEGHDDPWKDGAVNVTAVVLPASNPLELEA